MSAKLSPFWQEAVQNVPRGIAWSLVIGTCTAFAGIHLRVERPWVIVLAFCVVYLPAYLAGMYVRAFLYGLLGIENGRKRRENKNV